MMIALLARTLLWLLLPVPVLEPPLPPEVAHIRWQDAADYFDRDCVVYGRVVVAATTKNWCFLNFDPDYRHTFTVAIPRHAFDKFPKPPEEMYAQQDIAVTGRIVEYEGKPEIVIAGPDAIQIGASMPAQPPPADARTATPATQPAPASQPAFTGVVTVATFNTLNLFDDQDDPYHADEGTPPKPREELEHLAAAIRQVNADVLALQEVENRFYLERFNELLLSDLGYENVVLYEGNDRRGIDVALLSRLPVGPVTSYRHLRFPDGNGQSMAFQRDLLRARIDPPAPASAASGQVPPPSFDLFVVHLKSKRGQDEQRTLATRLGEARAIRRIFDEILASDPTARFLICGDFNDTLDSQPLQTVLGTGPTALTGFANDLPAESRISYNQEPYQAMIDFLLASPALARHYRPGSYRILPGSIPTTGSDHNPVIVEFDLR